MIKAIIVDDEQKSRKILQQLVHEHCPFVEVRELCDSVEQALVAIEKHAPGLVFLDIEMPFNNGFNLLEKIEKPAFDVIFVTAYDHYAIKAIKFSAMDYLLKPVDEEELKRAVDKLKHRDVLKKNTGADVAMLLANLKSKSARIAVPAFDGLEMISIEDIVKCTSNDTYTTIFLAGGKKTVVSRILKDYEELLGDYNFLRIHHSCLINLKQVARYVKGDGGYVIMADGSTCEVSRRKKAELMSRLTLIQV